MQSEDLNQHLIDLFHRAHRDHKQAFIETDGFDPEWPLWYADYLREPLQELLGTEFTKSELVYLLVLLDKEQQLRSPEDWAHDYAKYFIEQYV